MRFRDDERGQSVQIGAVLLFATLVVAFSSYQAFVVPQQNQGVEFNHNQQVQDEMQELRNLVVSMAGGGPARSTSVTLGTTYPSRLVAQNPGPPSGSLRTDGTADPRIAVSIRNATASGETGDVWDGSQRTFNTGSVIYDPSYNVYGEAPRTVYEHSVAYNEFRSDTLTVTGQAMVDDRRLSLVAVNGSLDRSSSAATSVDVRPVSSSTETVPVSAADEDSPVTLNVTSRLSASRWRELLADQAHVRSVSENTAAAPDPYRAVQITLDPDVAYRLQLTKVGVGSRVSDEGPEYLTDVDGEGSSVTRGESQRLTLAVRDRYDNPVPDVSVNASVGPGKGSFADGSKSTDGDGEVTFEYRTTGSTAAGTHQLNFTTNDSSALSTRPFDQSRPKNVGLDVTVTESSGGGGGSAGAYRLSWTDPSRESANGDAALTSCSSDACTWDVGASDTDELTLNSTMDPPYEGVDVDYGVSDSTVGTVSPGGATTGSTGSATTRLTAKNDGPVSVLAAAGDDSDDIGLEVVNVTTASGTTVLLRVEDVSHLNEGSARYIASYEVRDAGPDFEYVSVEFRNNDSPWASQWSNSTDRVDTRTYQAGGAAGDPYDVVVTTRDADDDALASATISDAAANGRNASGNDELGGGSPAFTSYSITDDSNNGQGARYGISYTTEQTDFDRVRAFLVSLDPNAGGADETTFTATSDSGRLSTYGWNSQDPVEFKVVLQAYNTSNANTDTVVWTDSADGSGSTSG